MKTIALAVVLGLAWYGALARQPFDLVFGDSVAEGVRVAGGLRGVTRVSAHSAQILATIRRYSGALAGRSVVLSSGAANDYAAVRYSVIREQVEILLRRGARVTLLGVGCGIPGHHAINRRLREISRAAGIHFAGELPTTGRPCRVHPRNYRAVIRGALAATQ